MLSLREFAKIAGVSRMTVSRAFSDSTEIAEETRRRLLELAEQYDFRPCAVRPSAQNGRTRSVGVMYPAWRISYFSDIAAGIQDELLESGFLPIPLAIKPQTVARCLNRLIDHRVDGLIITCESGLGEPELTDLLRLKVPLVHMGDSQNVLDCDSIDSDKAGGGEQVAEHLLSLGHRDIALCTSDGALLRRTLGFKTTLAKQGISLPADRIIVVPQNETADAFLVAELEAMLTSSRPPTAIFAGTDPTALTIYHVAGSLGISIPDDLSVVGFADLNYAERLWPALTTVRQNGDEEGREGARHVIRRIEGDASPYQRLLVPTELIVRNSTKALNQR